MSAQLEITNLSFLKWLRILSFCEGISTLVLFFIAMPMKYGFGVAEAVSWPGRIHGAFFVVVCLLAVIAIKKVPLPAQISIQVIFAALIPFGPFFMDKRLKQLSLSRAT